MKTYEKKVYERIRALREGQHMSQQELAEKIGYKDKSAISKVERGERDINQSLLIKYADALGVSPAYLMGWEEAPSAPAGGDLKLSEGERELLALFRAVPKEHQRSVIELVRVHVNSISAARMGDRKGDENNEA